MYMFQIFIFYFFPENPTHTLFYFTYTKEKAFRKDFSMSDCRCNRGNAGNMYFEKKESFPEYFPVAMAYVPWQTWNHVYAFDKALCTGTLFPELDKPFIGRRACQ